MAFTLQSFLQALLDTLQSMFTNVDSRIAALEAKLHRVSISDIGGHSRMVFDTAVLFENKGAEYDVLIRGRASIDKDLTVEDNIYAGKLDVDERVVLHDQLTVDGNAHFMKNVNISGDINVDKFARIDGQITKAGVAYSHP